MPSTSVLRPLRISGPTNLHCRFLYGDVCSIWFCFSNAASFWAPVVGLVCWANNEIGNSSKASFLIFIFLAKRKKEKRRQRELPKTPFLFLSFLLLAYFFNSLFTVLQIPNGFPSFNSSGNKSFGQF